MKKKFGRVLTAGLVALQLSTAVPFNVLAEPSTNTMNSIYEGNSNLVSVVSVNGNKLVDADIVNIGDTVTFDIVVTPGNVNLMSIFKDTLPEGLKFLPNSKMAYTVYLVNNDGSIGKEITEEGVAKIDGKVFTWTPNEPSNYLFMGASGESNRLLFHITAVVEHAVKPDTVLDNIAEIEFKNPRDPNKKIPPIKDSASVKIPKTPNTPAITKTVYKEDDKGNIPARLPSGGTVDTKTAPVFKVDTDQAYNDMKQNIADFIVEADKHKVDTKKLSEMLVGFTEKSDDAYRNAMIAEFKATVLKYNEVMAKELKNVGEASKADALVNDIYKGVDAADNITLDKIEENYTYVMNLHIPSQSISKSLEIEDFIENVQTVKAENVHVYNDRGEDITAQGTVNIEPYQFDKNKLTWTAKEDFVESLKADNTDKTLQMRVTGVTVRDARGDDLERYRLGGVITVPNTSTVVFDNFRKHSNKTLVRTPNPKEYKDHSILKGVSLQDGKVELAEQTYCTAGDKYVKLYDKIDGFKASVQHLMDKGDLSVDDKAKLTDMLNKLNDSSTKAEKEALVKSLAEKSKKITFDEGSNTVKLSEYKDLYKYNLNVSVHPEKIQESFVVEDTFEDIQNVDLANVRVFDETGKDIGNAFTMKLDKNVFTATASKELVAKIKAAKEESKFQFIFYNVSLKDDDNLKKKYVVDNDLISVPNSSKLFIDGKEVKSNVVNVQVKVSGVKPNKDKPEVPKVKTSDSNIIKPITDKPVKVIKDSAKTISNGIKDSVKDIQDGVKIITSSNPDIKTGAGKIFLNPLMLIGLAFTTVLGALGFVTLKAKKRKEKEQ